MVCKRGERQADFTRSLQNSSGYGSVQDGRWAAYWGSSQNAGMNPGWQAVNSPSSPPAAMTPDMSTVTI